MIVARTLAWILALVAAVIMMGLIDLGTVFGLSDPQYRWEVPLEASWGSLFTFVIAGSFGWVGSLPHRPWPALVLLAVTAGSIVIAGMVLRDPAPLIVGGLLALSTLTLDLLLRPDSMVTGVGPPTASIRTVAYAAGIPVWLGYAWISAADAFAGVSDDITNGVAHWPIQVALGITLMVGCGLALVWRGELVLWRVAFGATAFIVAYASLAYPDRGGAMPHWLWGVGFAVWGILILLPPPSSEQSTDSTRLAQSASERRS